MPARRSSPAKNAAPAKATDAVPAKKAVPAKGAVPAKKAVGKKAAGRATAVPAAPTVPAAGRGRDERQDERGRRQNERGGRQDERKESRKALVERCEEIVRRLAEAYPGSAEELCALRHENAYQLLVATILSAQCTDERVNLVTPSVFARYPTPEDLAAADPAEVEQLIRSTGFFRAKTASLMGMAKAVVERFDSEIPEDLSDLDTLPGVGRKTGNVVRSVGYGLPGLPVDTHVLRLSRRLGLTANTDAVKVESDLCSLVPESQWGALSLRLILHGRRVCVARRPRCELCVLAELCPSAFAAG